MPLITRILAPVDFSAPFEGAARYAQSIARQIKCELTLLHVLVPPAEFSFSPIGIDPERLDELMAAKSRAIQGALDSVLGPESNGLTVKRLLVKGDPAEQILLYAKSGRADLIVMPTHGYDPIRRFLLGSVVTKVLHGAEIPVLTGVHFEEHATWAFPPRQIVCGVDLGPNSARVLECASHLAEEVAGQLTVVHATPDIGERPGDSIKADWRVRLADQVRELVARLQQAVVGKVEVVVAEGDPHKVLHQIALRVNAGMLVIGRGASAEGPFGRLRAHAYAIVRASSCPVISV
jgi:nucleotide-binding universal stress UspA family protein